MTTASVKKALWFCAFAIATLILAGVWAQPAHADVSCINVGHNQLYTDSEYEETVKVPGVTFDKAANTLTLDNATIKCDSNGVWISGDNADVVTVVLKGKNTINWSNEFDDGIYSDTQLVFKGSGSLTINGVGAGITGYNVTMKSGTYNISNCHQTGIEASKNVAISGGKVNVTCESAANCAIDCGYNGKISNSYKRLGRIRGRLGTGATFKSDGNTYKVRDYSEVKLVSYGSKKTKANASTTKFGGYKYRVSAIGANAFNTKAGHKVTSVTLGSSVEGIGKHAFYKTSKLKTLNMRSAWSLFGYNSSSKWTTKGVAKGALSKCGKSGGKGLTVKTGGYGYVKKQTKKALVRVGLSSKAKVVR